MGSRWYYNYEGNFKCGLTLQSKYFLFKKKTQKYTLPTCRGNGFEHTFTPCWGRKVSEVIIEPLRIITRHRAAAILIEPYLEGESVNSQDLHPMEFESPNFAYLNLPDNDPFAIKEEVINVKQESGNDLSVVQEEVIGVMPELGNDSCPIKSELVEVKQEE